MADGAADEEADRCPICLEPAREPVRCLNCGNCVCKACIDGVLKRSHMKQECPMCRHPSRMTDAQRVAALQPNADRGAAWAQCELGVCYYKGEGVDQSFEHAIELWAKAVEQGYAKAHFNLGCCYYEGEGVAQSFEQAVKWIATAAEQGDAKAQCALGSCFYKGEGVAQSFEQAVKWMTKAAEQGHVEAQ